MVHTRQNLRLANHTRHRHAVATTRQHLHGKMPAIANTFDVVHDSHGALSQIARNAISFGNHRSRLERRTIFAHEFVIVVDFVVTQGGKQTRRVLLNLAPKFFIENFDFGLFGFNGSNLGLHVASHRIERSGQVRELTVAFDENRRFDVSSGQTRNRIEQCRLLANEFFLQCTVEFGSNGSSRYDCNRQLFPEHVQYGAIAFLKPAWGTIAFEVHDAQKFVPNDQRLGNDGVSRICNAFLHDRRSSRPYFFDNLGVVRKFVWGNLFFARFTRRNQFEFRIGARFHHEKQGLLDGQKAHDFVESHACVLPAFQHLRGSETQFQNA